MGIIYNGSGEINELTDPFNNYFGKISIQLRGSTSQSSPKKSYRFETQDLEGQNLNVCLIDLPEENDWILYGPYSDKSLVRDVLIYELSRRMGWYAPRTRFCEVMIDSGYMGVYVLLEKIKRDDNRVDIAKLTSNDTSGCELTGGYLLQIDRWDDEGWFSAFNCNVYFKYIYPDGDEILPQQKNYIQDFIYQFEDSLNLLANFNNSIMADKVDFDSFIDYIILNELSKNIDAYRLSTYLYKDKNLIDGRLKMGPIWDYNVAFGNNYNHFAYQTESFIYSDTAFWDTAPFWFRKLMSFEAFQNRLKCRWLDLRNTILYYNSITSIIDSCYNLLSDAQQRNFEKWDILGMPVWPNYYFGETYEEEIEILEDWIQERLYWLDYNFPGQCISSQPEELDQTNEFHVNIFPNPFSSMETIKYYLPETSTVELKIFDQYGRLIYSMILGNRPKGLYSINLNTEDFTPGIYFIQLILDGKIKSNKLAVKAFH